MIKTIILLIFCIVQSSVLVKSQTIDVSTGGLFTNFNSSPFASPPTKASVIVVSLGFTSNLGRPVIASCDEICSNKILLTNTTVNLNNFFVDNSNGQFSINSNIRYLHVPSTSFASSLGCTLQSWGSYVQSKLLHNLQIDITQYYFQIILLPAQAGGGSCSRSRSYSLGSCAGKGILCPVFMRTADPRDWLVAMSNSMGINRTNDVTDATNFGLMRYSAFWRNKMGWLPQNTVHTLTTAGSLNVLSSSGNIPLFGSKIVLIKYKEKLFVSLRTCNNDTYDRFLNSSHCNMVYVHDDNGSLVSMVSLNNSNNTYINYDTDLTFTLTNVTFGIATLSIKFCIPSILQPQLLTTAISVIRNTQFVSQIDLRVTNPSLYCAPVTQNFYLNEVKSLPTCNRISIVIAPDLNPLEISYDVKASDGTLILQGGFLSNSTVYCGKYGETITATMRDFGGDGYCCQYGGGSYYRVLINDVLIKQGGVFTFVDTVTFSNRLMWTARSLPYNTTATLKTLMTIPNTSATTTSTYSLSLAV
jgi:hypothetical protein